MQITPEEFFANIHFVLFGVIFFLNLCLETGWYVYFKPRNGFGEPVDKIICYIIFYGLSIWATFEVGRWLDLKTSMLIFIGAFVSSGYLAKQIKKFR